MPCDELQDHGAFWFLHCRQPVDALWIRWHDDFTYIIEKKDLPGRERGVFYWWLDGEQDSFWCEFTFTLDVVEIEWVER